MRLLSQTPARALLLLALPPTATKRVSG
jgi:hypothetical protein